MFDIECNGRTGSENGTDHTINPSHPETSVYVSESPVVNIDRPHLSTYKQRFPFDICQSDVNCQNRTGGLHSKF